MRQQFTCLIINALCGGLNVFSGDLANLSDEIWSEVELFEYFKNCRVSEVQNISKDHYVIHFLREGQKFAALCNLDKKSANFNIQNQNIRLEPFETIILKIR